MVQEHDSSSSLTQVAQLGAQRGPLADELTRTFFGVRVQAKDGLRAWSEALSLIVA